MKISPQPASHGSNPPSSSGAAKVWLGLFLGFLAGGTIGYLMPPGSLTSPPSEGTSKYEVPRPGPSEIPTKALPSPALDESVRKGEELAKVLCVTCHIFPEPAILDRFTWANSVLPTMAQYLGFFDYDYANEPGGERIRAAGIIPDAPLIPSADWKAIFNYYIENAPYSLPPQPPRPKIEIGLPGFEVVVLPYSRGPTNTLVRVDPYNGDIYVGNMHDQVLDIIDITAKLKATVRLQSPVVDLQVDEKGIYANLIGSIDPSDLPSGMLLYMDKPGPNAKAGRTLLQNLQRPTRFQRADFNQDGREDLVVSEYGHMLGQFAWHENTGRGDYIPHVLLDYAGAIDVEVHDMDGNQLPDILVMTAQGREAIHLYSNRGKGTFELDTLAHYHPAWGNAGFETADFNGDGHLDLLTINGDNGENKDYPAPMKPYHGLRILLNDGKNHFKETWFFPLNGAYGAVIRDFDQDGDLDICATGYYPDYQVSPAESVVYLRNEGDFKFTPFSFAESISGRWITLDAGDVDQDGDLDIVLGAFNSGPGASPTMLVEQWVKRGSSVIVLKNGLKP